MDGTLTPAGSFMGTAAYAAPEQIAGAELDGRVDVYALGCVLYQSLTGQVPFPRENVLAILAAHAHALPPRPSSSDPGLAPFDDVIARAMAKDREQRYPTAGALAEAAATAR
jgi:serine/threonine-protein kinase